MAGDQPDTYLIEHAPRSVCRWPRGRARDRSLPISTGARHCARALLIAAMLAAVFGSAAPQAAAAEPGVNVASADPGSFGLAASTGARWVRAFLGWSAVEPERGVIDDAALDPYRRAAAELSAAGVHVIWVVLGAPAWASQTGVAGGPPARPGDFALFLHTVAKAMAGTVGAYEIWNEPDEDVFWQAAPDAAQYASLLRVVYPAVKAADPNTVVLFGGLTGNNYRFLRDAYRAGAGPYFDAVAVHTDIPCELRAPRLFVRDVGGQISRWSFLGYRTVHATMLAHHDHRPIWMTELGWSASAVPCPSGVWAGQKPAGVGETLQAAYLTAAYACLAADPYVQVALWFNLSDNIVDESTGVRYGLARLDGTRRPAWPVFSDVAAADGAASGGCLAHYVGPHVEVSVRRVAGTGSLHVRVHLTCDLDVARFTVRIDGHAVYRRSAPPPRIEFTLPRKATRRHHRLTVAAVDVADNGGQATIWLEGR